MISKYVGIKCD